MSNTFAQAIAQSQLSHWFGAIGRSIFSYKTVSFELWVNAWCYQCNGSAGGVSITDIVDGNNQSRQRFKYVLKSGELEWHPLLSQRRAKREAMDLDSRRDPECAHLSAYG